MGILADTTATTAVSGGSGSGSGINWGGIGTQGVGEITGGLFSRMFSKFDDNRQYDQAARLQALQMQGAQQSADISQQEAYKTWLETNYPAQVEQLNKAGLNPALLYGGGGGSGGTLSSGSVPMPSGNDAGSGPARGQAAAAQAGMGLQLAQVGLIKAQTNAANATADNQESQADLNKNHQPAAIDAGAAQSTASAASLTQGIRNQQANEALTKVQTDIANIEKMIQGQSAGDQINTIANQAVKAVAEARSAVAQANIDEATQKTKINLVEEQYANMIADTMSKQADIANTNADTITKQYDANLAKAGMSKDSPWYVKSLMTLLQKAGIKPTAKP